MNFFKRKTKQKGFTAIELSIVLVAIVALTGVMYQTVVAPMTEKSKITQAGVEAGMLLSGAEGWAASDSANVGFAGITSMLVFKAGFGVGKGFGGSGTGGTGDEVLNPWGGVYTIAVDTDDDKSLTFTSTEIPNGSCLTLQRQAPIDAACTTDETTGLGSIVYTLELF